MNRIGTLVLTVAVAGGCLVLGVALIMAMVVTGASTDDTRACAPDGTVLLAGASVGKALSDDQMANASTIVSEGYRLGMPERAILVALTVASQESNFLVYANDGRGGDLAPDQVGVEKSMELQHQAVGSDHGSVGVFQQQWPWWGSLPELMDPATSARKFYTTLTKVRGWSAMSIPDAGQAVQHSAHPDAYDDDVAVATELLDAGPGSTLVEEAGYFGGANPARCGGTGSFSGDVVYPLAQGASYVDEANFGHAGRLWESTHTGTDLAASCGTPVVAATSGVVTVRTDQAWAGPWLVEVDAGAVVTWYAHMQDIDVRDGDRVRAGQWIGQVGSMGNATGCHLHFEVHPAGGAAVDPTDWLAENVGDTIGDVLPAAAHDPAVAGDTAVLMTANIPHWLSDRSVESRIRSLLDKGPDVLLLEEMGHRDVPAMVARAGGPWAAWQPSGRRGRTVIVWNTEKFSVARRGLAFGVRTHQYEAWMPWMLLDGESGTLPVVGIHLPTNASKDPRMAAYYRAMTHRYLRLLGQMNEAGYPPIVGGDWNHPLSHAREPWSPVPMLRRVGMTTNWRQGRPCTGTSEHDGRIDGFAFNPDYLQVVKQGCLDRGPSDHRPVWVAVAPVG